jgi:hypothetical protein
MALAGDSTRLLLHLLVTVEEVFGHLVQDVCQSCSLSSVLAKDRPGHHNLKYLIHQSPPPPLQMRECVRAAFVGQATGAARRSRLRILQYVAVLPPVYVTRSW